MTEKKEIRIPRLWVYAASFFAGLIVTTGFGVAFGVEYAIDFITSAVCYGVLFIAAYNIMDKIDKQPYRLTWRYWVLMALIVVTDFLFVALAKAPTKEDGFLRIGLLTTALVGTVCFALYSYAPEQKRIFADIKDASKAAICEYLDEHASESHESIAEGILALIFAPKKKAKEEAPEGEEANE